jgi:hypothetical protein
MKITLFSCFCSLASAMSALAQMPSPPPDISATPLQSPAATVSASATVTPIPPPPPPTAVPSVASAPAVAPSASRDVDEDIDSAIERKVRKHFNITFDGDHDGHHSSEVPWLVIPIVLIVFATPVLIVATILYFSFSKSRALHRTVRMMVEKGQPVPEALLNPPPVVRKRSDLRRGVVLLMIGIGTMVFFGAMTDWESGAWSLGIIPFLIGAGYLLVWRLDVHREEPSPPV